MRLDEIIKDVRVGESTVLDVAGEGPARKLTVEMRRLLPEEARPPKRTESPRRAHEFHSAASLADYLARYGTKDTVVFVDHENEEIHAVLGERDEAGFEVVRMKPQIHPSWKPWSEIAGQEHEIKEFASFVLQNRRAVVQPEGRALAMSLAQVRGSVSVEIMAGRGRGAVNGLVVRSRVNPGSEQSDAVDFPDSITLKVPLYVDTQPRELELDLCVEAGADGGVTVAVTEGTVADARVAAFNDMVNRIRDGVKGINALVTWGAPQHQPWTYLPETPAGPARA